MTFRPCTYLIDVRNQQLPLQIKIPTMFRQLAGPIGDFVDQAGQLFEYNRGAKTQIYSRVSGYFRPVANRNKSKKEEFADRVPLKVPSKEQFQEKTA